MKNKKLSHNGLQGSVTSVMAALLCILIGLFVGFLVLLAIAAIWFLVSRNPVVTTFVIPGICLVALVFDGVLLAVFRGTFVSGYAKYLLFDVGLGLIPLALQALGLTTWDVPSLVSALTASVFLLGLVVFARKQLTAEIRKLFSA